MTPQRRVELPANGTTEVEADDAEEMRFRIGEDWDTGPANQIIAKLALAIASDEVAEENPDSGVRWSTLKTITVLLVGCGLFWLVAFTAISTIL